MYRYQILIEYVGTNFKGWQIQKKGATIQGVIQENLSNLLKEKITLIGSGRTDSGVHAFEQSAHFDCLNKISDKLKFIKSINHFLNDYLEIACGDNQSIKIHEIQRQGKKVQHIGEFVLGTQIKKGSFL